MMRRSVWSGLLLGSVLCVWTTVGVTPVVAATAGQAIENAGHPATNVAQVAGGGIKRGTKKVFHKTAHGTKQVYHKTGHGVTKTGDKMQGKPSPQ